MRLIPKTLQEFADKWLNRDDIPPDFWLVLEDEAKDCQEMVGDVEDDTPASYEGMS